MAQISEIPFDIDNKTSTNDINKFITGKMVASHGGTQQSLSNCVETCHHFTSDEFINIICASFIINIDKKLLILLASLFSFVITEQLDCPSPKNHIKKVRQCPVVTNGKGLASEIKSLLLLKRK